MPITEHTIRKGNGFCIFSYRYRFQKQEDKPEKKNIKKKISKAFSANEKPIILLFIFFIIS